jgi:uncharacterized protein YciI
LGDDTGGIAVYDVADQAEAEAIFATDPYSTSGVAVRSTIRPWTIVLSRD